MLWLSEKPRKAIPLNEICLSANIERAVFTLLASYHLRSPELEGFPIFGCLHAC